jgi:cell division protein FtsI (penicillin-binding protein 3)
LTIDKELQYFTELTLAQAARTYHAEAGTAMVMKPGTGEILALANVPDFDPNRPGRFSTVERRNRALTDVYEPGSAYKIVAASGALNEKVVTPRTQFTVPDSFAYSDRVFHDSHPHPTERMTFREIIEQSSNVGTIQIGLKMGGSLIDDYVRAFGFGTRTGLDFPGESRGIVLDPEEWSGSTIATIPIGQGIAVTPLQMLSVYATVANDGVRVQPTLVRGHVKPGGEFVPGPQPVRRRVVSGETARMLTRMLTHAVRDGTGQAAEIPGYWVAGKTGTARKPLQDARGYSDRYVASFIGFAPAREPRIVVAAILDEPVTVYGGIAAAPLFREVTRFALAHLQVAPQRPPRVPPVAERPCTGC